MDWTAASGAMRKSTSMAGSARLPVNRRFVTTVFRDERTTPKMVRTKPIVVQYKSPQIESVTPKMMGINDK